MLKNAVKKKLFEKIKKYKTLYKSQSFKKRKYKYKALKNANYTKKISKHVERNTYKCAEVFNFA